MQTAYLFILPALAIYLVFVMIPVVQSMYISLFDWNGLSVEMEWTGLGNYVTMFTEDKVFQQSLNNSIIATRHLSFAPLIRTATSSAVNGSLICSIRIFKEKYFCSGEIS